MMSLKMPGWGDLRGCIYAALYYAVFFHKLYRDTDVMRKGTAAAVNFLLHMFLFGMTGRRSYPFVLLIHSLWCAGESVLLYRQLRVQKQYAIFLAVIFVLTAGIWNRQLLVFLCPEFDGAFIDLVATVNAVLNMGTLYVVQRFIVVIERGRRISWSELFAGLFPACISFMARIGIYHYTYYLQEMSTRQAVAAFSGIGAFLAFSTIVSIGASEKYFAYLHNRHELEMAEQQLKSQYDMFKEQRKGDEMLKRVCHDMANHMNVLQGMADMESVQEYIQGISRGAKEALEDIDTGNGRLNLSNGHKRQACVERGIVLEAAVSFGQGGFLNPPEICTLFANCIDNAMEAVEQDEVKDRTIRMRGGPEHGCLVVRFENEYNHTLREGREGLLSSKSQGVHGYGLRNVRSVLKRHDGALNIRTEDGRFILVWMIPLPG